MKRAMRRQEVVAHGASRGSSEARFYALLWLLAHLRAKQQWLPPLGIGSLSLISHGRTRMIVFPLIRSVGLKAATASSRGAT